MTSCLHATEARWRQFVYNRELEELQKRLQVAELESGCTKEELDRKNKENILAVHSEQLSLP